MFSVGITHSVLRAFMQWDFPGYLISFHSYFTKCDIIRLLSIYCRGHQHGARGHQVDHTDQTVWISHGLVHKIALILSVSSHR